MKVQMLPSSIDENGTASARQHLLTIVIDDCVAIDAGCLAFSCSDLQRRQIRDVVLTHPHLDHIAGLPMFIDDLFSTLDEPIRVHATREMIDILERDIFNWSIYPKFSDLSNGSGPVIEYREFSLGEKFEVQKLNIHSVAVNHKVSASGFVISGSGSTIAITGDTGETDEFWQVCSRVPNLSAVLVECAFPDEYAELARVSHHLTPTGLASELKKLENAAVPVYIINIKPMFRDRVTAEIEAFKLPNVEVLEVGEAYEF